DNVELAGKAIGWTPTVIDGTADQNKQRQALETLIAQKTQAVGIGALDPHGLSAQLKQLNAAKIPWGGINTLHPEQVRAIRNLDATGTLVAAGKQLGAWTANDSHGKAKVLMMSSTDNPALQLRDKGFKDYLERFPGISFVGDTKYVPFSAVGPPLQAQVESIL